MSLWNDIKWYLCPSRCICCDDLVDRDVVICDDCRPNVLPKPHYALIPNSDNHLFCCFSGFYYGDPLIRQTIINLKFNGMTSIAKIHADYLSKMSFSYLNSVDIVTCVPLSKGRKRWRGFNQAELIATAYANFTGKPYDDLLKKLRSNSIQSTISNENDRKSNVKGMYEVLDPEKIKGKNILIIDDVFTTGSTMKECAKMLKKGGAANVFGMTVASAN